MTNVERKKADFEARIIAELEKIVMPHARIKKLVQVKTMLADRRPGFEKMGFDESWLKNLVNMLERRFSIHQQHSSTIQLDVREKGGRLDDMRQPAMDHRQMRQPAKSSLKKKGSRKKRRRVRFCSDYVTEVAVNSYSSFNELWFQMCEFNVVCDKCERTVTKEAGLLQGAPGCSNFSQLEFVCLECCNASSMRSLGVVCDDEVPHRSKIHEEDDGCLDAFSPAHRDRHEPAKSSLKKKGMRKNRCRVRYSSKHVSEVGVESFKSEDDLWFQMCGSWIVCDKCGRSEEKDAGSMQGAPGRSMFSQLEFLCLDCCDASSMQSRGIAFEDRAEQHLAKGEPKVGEADRRVSLSASAHRDMSQLAKSSVQKNLDAREKAGPVDVMRQPAMEHRQMRQPAKSSLKRKGSRKKRGRVRYCPEYVTEVAVNNYSSFNELWFQTCGYNVVCDCCERTVSQSEGSMHGAAGFSTLSYSEFLCMDCFDASSIHSLASVVNDM